jgi:hypothetical protein
MRASATKTIVNDAAHVKEIRRASGMSAHEATYDARMLPTRPIATVVPSPPRIAVETCAASDTSALRRSSARL